ncbi:MAG: hypothetical protein GY793_03775 [Proteobacteria bacterium]|nr:hypothetical protein [Pseudomonadota bacterium]
MNFYVAKWKMESLVSGDMAIESLENAEDEHTLGDILEPEYTLDYMPKESMSARDVPHGEDIKWVCGDCMATDWTPICERCKCCK